MRKFLILMLALVILFAGCGKKTDENVNEESGKQQSSSVQGENNNANKGEFEDVETKVDEPIVNEETTLGDYTSEFLSKYVENGSYYIEQNSIINGTTTTVEIAVDGDKAAERIGSQVKIVDGETLYYVIHDSKMIVTSPSVSESMKDGFTDFISVKTSTEAKSALQNTGEEELQGEKFGFEEFKNEDGVTAKYYYDDTTLRYVKIIKADNSEELIQVVKISNNIPDDIFKIPDGYVIQDLNKISQQ